MSSPSSGSAWAEIRGPQYAKKTMKKIKIFHDGENVKKIIIIYIVVY